MKHLPRISSLLYCEPWAIRPEVHGQILAQFESYVLSNGMIDRSDADSPVGPSYTSPWTGKTYFQHSQAEVLNNVALLRVHGIIGKHLSSMEVSCGGYDIGYLREQLGNIEMDDSIDTVVIDFRTPGGTVIGLEFTAKAIRAVSQSGKKVIGYSDYDCCSAGYWLASACDEFYAEGSAMVGSISTICAGVDSSEEWKEKGRKLMLFRTGDKKGIGLPGKEWEEQEIAFMQEKSASIDKDFKDFVRERRNLTDEQMQGQYWYAKHAPAGIVDGIVDSLDDLLQVVLKP